MQGDNGNDLGRLQSIMRTIELACSSIQMHVNPAAAEATILSLSQSPQPYQACKFILENSQVANARFQAAAAIRDAALREWGILTSVDKGSLINFCLCFVMQHASSSEGYVQTKVSSVAAQLLKRGWLEFVASEKEAFLFQVSEFSPSTSTAMGLPREFHEQCRMSLELDYLKEAAASVTNRIVESDSEVPEVKVCTASMRLMLQILNWDFRYSSDDSAKTNVDVFSVKARNDAVFSWRSECVIVQPGPSWQQILLSSGHVSWVLNLYGALRHKFSLKGYWLDCPIAVSARKLIVQLCSLTGNIFPSDNVQMREHHLVQLLSGIIQWIHPPDVISRAIESGKSESEFLDGCRALLAVATVTSPFMYDQLLKSICPFGTINLLSGLMSEVVKVLMSTGTDEETWGWVARDILLDTWTAILTPSGSSDGAPSIPLEGISAAASLFALIVESELKTASATAFNDDDSNDYLQASIFGMDERLNSYGLIARASIEYSVPFLTKVFLERLAQLQQVRGRSDPTAILEEIYSLLLITGQVLADEGEGELPLVPEAIQTHFLDSVEGDKHPVVILSSSILRFAEQSIDPEVRASIFSPRLMEAVIWFLARWSRTYLMSPEGCGNNANIHVPEQLQHSKKVLMDFFGELNQGKLVLDLVVRISMTTLISYPGEKDLQELTCRHLLNGLVGYRDIGAHLVYLDSWRELAKCFVNERNLFSLSAPHQRSLARTLVLSASALRDLETSNQYVRDLMNHMTAYLLDLSGKHDIKNVSQQPETIMVVCCLLERLRGSASASEPRTQRAIYEMGVSVMDSIIKLLEVYKNEWVSGQISYLEAQETATLINFCMRLLQIYSSHNIGKISISHSKTLASEANTEKYKDLRALIQLLASLCTKDLIDFSTDSVQSEAISIAQVVFVGLHIITPLISIDLLKYPKLCHDYFSLMSHMLEVYPEMVGQLNAEALAHIIGTLDFGIRHQDSEIFYKCLRALKALASFHYKETIAGNVGLGSHAASGVKDTGENVQEGILSRFLPSLLQLLLFEDYSTDLVSAAADALLPLILCEPSLYQRLCSELIDKQTNPAFQTRLTNALHALTSSNQLSSTLDRINHQRFRKNLLEFLVEVRGFLRMV
uniref:Exportin-4 n=1 Tax=Chenopodium quinoa TaxID=63459 RepID=A0A803N5Q3_CHEQI